MVSQRSAGFLGNLYEIPVLYLDKVHWLAGWTEREREEELLIVEDFLKQNDSWVIDGNYSKLFFEERLNSADKIIFMNFNRFSCLFRVFRRYISNKGKTRNSMTQGCNEKIDTEFIKWILKDGRSSDKINTYKKIVSKHSDKVIEIKNQHQLTKLKFNLS